MQFEMKHMRIFRQEQQYRRLFAAGLVNGIGDRFNQVAVLGLLLSLTGSGLAVGITFAVRLFPYLVFGPLGGLLADRFSKKSIMIFSDVARFFFALTPLLVHEPRDVWIIYASSFVLSAGEAMYAPARMSLIPRLVQKNNLLPVNSLEQAMVGIVLIGGSVTGGIVSALVGGQVSFVLNAMSFLVSALLLLRLDTGAGPAAATDSEAAEAERAAAVKPDTDTIECLAGHDADTPAGVVAPDASGQHPVPVHDWQQTAAPRSRSNLPAGFRRFLSGSFFLRIMFIVFTIWPIGDGVFNILISVYAAEVFHMGDIGIGLLYGALGAGMLAGSSLTGKMAGHMKTATVFALLLEGVFQVVISQSQSFVLLIALMIVSASITSIGNACNETILMSLIPASWQGRFFGTLATLQNTIMGITMFAVGFLLEAVTPRTLGLAAGRLLTALGLGMGFVWFSRAFSETEGV